MAAPSKVRRTWMCINSDSVRSSYAPVYKPAAPTKSSYLDTLVAGKAITTDSKDWLTGALDPFHDFNYSPEGLPDQYSGSTVVQFIKRKHTIVAPSTLADGQKWDCHIYTAPIMTSETALAALHNPGYIGVPNTSLTRGLGTLNVCRVVSDANTVYDSGNYANFSPCDNGNDFSMMRIIGGGFEVHNDTAELYKNGSITVYSQASESCSRFVTADRGLELDMVGVAQQARLPPVTIAEATSLVNARTWSALDGCYVPFILDVRQSEFQQATASPLILNKVDSSAAYGALTTALVTNFERVNAESTALRATSPLRSAGLETVGAYFTGLTKETVLTLDIRFIVEVAPTAANTTLTSLASPSSRYDPTALELYSRAVRELPPGVKVSMNAAGDWWRIVSSAIRLAAPIVSKMGPYGQAAAAAAQGIQAIGDRVLEQRLNKKIEKIEKAEKEKEKNRNTVNPRTSTKLDTSGYSTKALKQVLRDPGPSRGGSWKAMAKGKV